MLHGWSWPTIRHHLLPMSGAGGLTTYTDEYTPQCCHLRRLPSVATIMKEMVGFLSVIVAYFGQETLAFLPPFWFLLGITRSNGGEWMAINSCLRSFFFIWGQKPLQSSLLLFPSFLIWLDVREEKGSITITKKKDHLISLFMLRAITISYAWMQLRMLEDCYYKTTQMVMVLIYFHRILLIGGRAILIFIK